MHGFTLTAICHLYSYPVPHHIGVLLMLSCAVQRQPGGYVLRGPLVVTREEVLLLVQLLTTH